MRFEFTWKTIWAAAIGMRLWSAHPIGASDIETFKASWFGLTLLSVVIPWQRVIDSYFRSKRDRWKRAQVAT